MTYTTDNMSRLLGNAATNEDAERFGEFLEERGWELLENSDGHMYPYRNGEAMTEQEWQEELAACFTE